METKDVILILMALVGNVVTILVAISNERARTTVRFDALAKETDDKAEALARDARARDEAIAKDMQAEVASMHSRINDTRDNYVRRDDFAAAMARIEQGQNRTADEISRLRHGQADIGTTVSAIAAHLNVEDMKARKRQPPAAGED